MLHETNHLGQPVGFAVSNRQPPRAPSGRFCRRYECKCHSLNAASRAAAQRLGFSFEGMFRQAAVRKGRNRDTAWYAVIDQERPLPREAFQRWLDPADFGADGAQRTSLSAPAKPILEQCG